MAGEEEDVQRRQTWCARFQEDLERANITWEEPKRLNTLRWIVFSGVKLLPNVPGADPEGGVAWVRTPLFSLM